MSKRKEKRKCQPSTTNIASPKRCKPDSSRKDETLSSLLWQFSECRSMLYYYPEEAAPSSQIAGFDVNGTIIRMEKGARRVGSAKEGEGGLNDKWQLWSSQVRPTLRRLVDEGHRIVLFTNQQWLGKKGNEDDIEKWKFNMEQVIQRIGLEGRVTVMAYVGGKDKTVKYCKPHTGMWCFLKKRQLAQGGPEPDMSQSFFVGSSAGRPKGKGASEKRDSSALDLTFALNVGGGMKFFTPEQMFLGSRDRRHCDRSIAEIGFDPKKHWREAWNEEKGQNVEDRLHTETVILAPPTFRSQEVLIVVGCPASGKSSLTKRLILQKAPDDSPFRYKRINQDELKSVKNCVKVAMAALEDGFSVVVDNTNRDAKARAVYADLATKFGVRCRCLWLMTSKAEAFHLNAYRGLAGSEGDANGEVRSVPPVAIHSYFKHMEPPNAETEGFSTVLKVAFVPGPFSSDSQRNLFFQFMV